MVKIAATIGWSSDVVIYSIDDFQPSEVILFYGYRTDDERVETAIRDVRFYCERKVRVRTVRVDPFIFEDCIEKMNDVCRDEDIIMNVTGGTKIMYLAATLVALKFGIPMVYYETINNKKIRMTIPVHKIAYKKGKGKRMRCLLSGHRTQMNILEILMNEKEGIEANELGRKLNINKSTVNEHLSKLEKANVLRIDKRYGRKIVMPYPTIKYVYDLMMEVIK